MNIVWEYNFDTIDIESAAQVKYADGRVSLVRKIKLDIARYGANKGKEYVLLGNTDYYNRTLNNTFINTKGKEIVAFGYEEVKQKLYCKHCGNEVE